MATWLLSYGDAFDGDWVSFWHDLRCVGGCLLLTRRAKVGPFPVRLAVINTAAEDAEESPWVEYNDVLCVAGFEERVATALGNLLQQRTWDRLYLSGFGDGGVLSRLRRRYPIAEVEQEVKPSPYVDLASMTGDATSLLSSNSRAQIKRSFKLYGQRGKVHVTPAGTLAAAHEYLKELARLHRSGWKRRSKDGGFRTGRFLDFHCQLIEGLWNEGGVTLLRASAGEQAIGYLYNFIHAGKVYFYQSGFAYEEDSKLKPGMVAHCLAIDHFRSLGLCEYDFMAGDARYKTSLANAARQLQWVWIERATPRMRLVRVVRSIKRKLMSASAGERDGNQD